MGRRPKGYFQPAIETAVIKADKKDKNLAQEIFKEFNLACKDIDDWNPEELVSKDTAYRQAIYSDLADKKSTKQRALPFLQKTLDDAFGVKDISQFDKLTSDELADGFIRACIIDYLYGSGSMYNAWRAVCLLKGIKDFDVVTGRRITKTD
jgi:hypothetical protein